MMIQSSLLRAIRECFLPQRLILFAAVHAIHLSCMTPDLYGEEVYNSFNNPGSNGGASYGVFEMGNQVQLAGTARVLETFQVLLTPQGFDVTADIKARFYANDGTGGSPGTLLGESPWALGVNLSGQYYGVGWGGGTLGFTVPDEFTWTVQIANSQPTPVGVALVVGPPSIGQGLATWSGSPADGWTSTSSLPLYGAYFFATPEPSTLILATCGGLALFGMAKRRHSRI